MSSFTDFGALDSLAALQGLFCISVGVALVWIHSATASAVSFFLLLQVGLLALFGTMSFWIFSLMARHFFFQPFCVSVLGGYAARISSKQHGLTCFLCGSISTRFSVFVFLSSLSCLTSSGAFRGRISTKFDCPNTSRKYSSVKWGISCEFTASNHPWSLQTYFHKEIGKLTRCCLWTQDARILGRHTLEESNHTSKNLFLPDTAGKINMLFSGFCVGRVAPSILTIGPLRQTKF